MTRTSNTIQPPTQAATVRVFLPSRMLAAGNEKGRARHIVNEHAPRNPRRHLFFERDSGKSRRVQKVLDAENYEGQRDERHGPQ